METLRFGQITGAVGIRGEVRVYPLIDYKEQFEQIQYVLMDGKPFSIQAVRYMKAMAILKLEGIDDRNKAESLKGKELLVYRKDAPPLPPDAYYIRDLIGLRILDETGRQIGVLKDVIPNAAQDLYEVERMDGGKTFLIPAVEEFITSIDMEEGTLRVQQIEGLMQL